MLSIIQASRPLNLFIVALTQYFFYYLFFINGDSTGSLSLYPNLLYPFIAVTLIITACGYYINDYFDYNSDIDNQKTNKLKHRSNYLSLYFFFLITGFVLAYWIAYSIGRPFLSLIYIIANLLLFLYSSHWKKQVLIGNIIVALFSAFVMLIIVYAEWEVISSIAWQQNTASGEAISIIVFYSAFIFLISMIREMLKDIEDIEGDRAAGYRTLPIINSPEKAQVLSGLNSIILILLMASWYYSLKHIHDTLLSLFFGIAILAPTVLLTIFIFKAQDKKQFHHLSQFCKAIMLSGLIYLILLM